MHPEEPYVLEALQAGAVGYVLKTQAAVDIVQAIHTVLQGATYLSPRVTNAIMKAYLACATLSPDPLTSRECKIVQRIAEGQTTKEIAAHLGLSVKTVESHGINLMRKLDIHETATLVRYAIRRGAAPPEGDTAVSGGCRRSPFPPFPAQAFPRAPSGIYRMAVPARMRYLPMSMTAWKCTKIGNLAMSCFSGIQFARMLVYEHYNPLRLCEIRGRRTRRRVL